MPSPKNKDYNVEKIVSKRTDGSGRTFYLIKWKGYSSSDNTWEPESHVNNCQDLVAAFEAEEAKKNKSNASQRRTSQRTARPSSSPLTKSTNRNPRPSRSSNRISSTRQHSKRASSNDSNFTDDEDENGDANYNGDAGKKSNKPSSPKRPRKSTTDTDTTPSIDSHDSDILDSGKLDHILDVRRNKKTDIIEYHIQVKKIKKTVWIKSDRLTEDYSQEVIDFLEEKYV